MADSKDIKRAYLSTCSHVVPLSLHSDRSIQEFFASASRLLWVIIIMRCINEASSLLIDFCFVSDGD